MDRNKEFQANNVRPPAEWAVGYVPGAVHTSGGELFMQLGELERSLSGNTPTGGSGYRSPVSASLLRQHGLSRVFNVIGGMSAWRGAGYDPTPAA